nr:MAG TPA: hypothetical protein [Caudoviricetes sp.]
MALALGSKFAWSAKGFVYFSVKRVVSLNQLRGHCKGVVVLGQ